MAEILLKKTLTGLVPLDAMAQEYWDKLGLGDVVRCKVSKPRNYRFLSKYWTLLTLILGNQDVFPDVDSLHGCVKRATGYSRVYELKNGDTYEHVGSISFAKMTEEEFEVYYKKVMKFICEAVIPGLEEEDLVRELISF